MEIRILQLEAGAKEAEGVTVIIDVFRAFSLESVLFRNGAEKIICVEKEELARKLHQDDPDTVLIGERNGRILPGFDYGNSPDAIKDIDFSGKTVIHTTTNGTRGLAEAKGASALLCASLRNAEATADYIRGLVPDVVSLVCMGWVDRETEEDTLCAEYLKSLLENRPLADLPERCIDLKNAEGKVVKVNAIPGHNIPIGALGAFVVTFVIYFWNLDMKLTSVMEGILLKHYDKIDRDQHL